MTTVLILTPSNSLKGNEVIKAFNNNKLFKEYKVLFCFETEQGDNISLLNFDQYLIVGKKINKCKLPEYDFLISCGWGWIIPDAILKKARLASINCHGSYLPDYKGGSVYKHYWANCEKYAGISFHFLTSEIDEGEVLLREKIRLEITDNPKDILIKQSRRTVELLPKVIGLIEKGYHGKIFSGGRYFKPIENKKLKFYRLINLFFYSLGLKYRIYTPNKKMKS
ncbi:MAG: formyltransferase family protein [Bacteroidales bacterium]|jgi:methionyl-tRNA formyltransferase|nr:formyltransferase family protein [Bacteroidales bacterium]